MPAAGMVNPADSPTRRLMASSNSIARSSDSSSGNSGGVNIGSRRASEAISQKSSSSIPDPGSRKVVPASRQIRGRNGWIPHAPSSARTGHRKKAPSMNRSNRFQPMDSIRNGPVRPNVSTSFRMISRQRSMIRGLSPTGPARIPSAMRAQSHHRTAKNAEQHWEHPFRQGMQSGICDCAAANARSMF